MESRKKENRMGNSESTNVQARLRRESREFPELQMQVHELKNKVQRVEQRIDRMRESNRRLESLERNHNHTKGCSTYK